MFGAKKHGLQSVLMTKLHLTKWDGSGTIHSHRDAMVNLRTELADAGTTISDQSFHEHFTNSLPSSLDLFITLYDDPAYDVDLLCDKSAKYEMRHKLADTKAGKAEGTSDGPLALFDQQASSSSKRQGMRDGKHITCYGCGKKGHIKSKCPDGENKDKTRNEKHEEKQVERFNAAKGTEANKQRPPTGSLSTRPYLTTH